MLAIRHARDNTDFYPPYYADIRLAWEIVSAEDSEDFYKIRLSFRPAGRRRGEPGLEEFIFDKVGELLVRQILDEPSDLGPRPSARPPRWGLRAAVGLTVIGVVAVGALFGSGIIVGGPTPTPTPAPAQALALAPTSTTLVEREAFVTATPGTSASPTPSPTPNVV